MKTSILVSSIALAFTISTQVTAFPGGQMGSCDVETRTTNLLEKFDIDQDGQITLTEVQAAKAQKFTDIDTDQSGSLTQAEMQAYRELMLAEMQQTLPEGKYNNGMRMGRHYFRMDTDGNGEISKDEFTARVPLFDRADADQDGIITQAEIAQMPCGRGGDGKGHRGGRGH